MSSLVVAGEKLTYTHHPGAAHAAAPPLLLIHGAGGNALHWPGALRRLADRTVYALDLPGHGHSTGQPRRTIGAYAEVVRDFMDALGLTRGVLAGHSMGGAIALEFALRYPGRLAGLILAATGACLPIAPELLQSLRDDLPAALAWLAERAHGAQADPNLDRIYRRRLRETAPAVLEADFLAGAAFDRRADVAAIRLPTLVIGGAADRMTPVALSQFLAAQIPGAELLIAPAAGHMVILEPAGLPMIVNAVLRFLGRCS
jgi:pimeloyl-ACP methyl ester carboxylesterase